jgi:hypothetical protein
MTQSIYTQTESLDARLDEEKFNRELNFGRFSLKRGRKKSGLYF